MENNLRAIAEHDVEINSSTFKGSQFQHKQGHDDIEEILYSKITNEPSN